MAAHDPSPSSSSSPNLVHTVALLLIVGTVLLAPSLLPAPIRDGIETAADEEDESGGGGLLSIFRPLLLMLLPLLLLVAVRWSSSEQAENASKALRGADESTIHRVTGSSPGLLLLLVLVLGMITFHSFLKESLGMAAS